MILTFSNLPLRVHAYLEVIVEPIAARVLSCLAAGEVKAKLARNVGAVFHDGRTDAMGNVSCGVPQNTGTWSQFRDTQVNPINEMNEIKL